MEDVSPLAKQLLQQGKEVMNQQQAEQVGGKVGVRCGESVESVGTKDQAYGRGCKVLLLWWEALHARPVPIYLPLSHPHHGSTITLLSLTPCSCFRELA